jgi:hypothetical protein
MSNTPQGEAIEGNAADDALMVNQGSKTGLTIITPQNSLNFAVELSPFTRGIWNR